MYPFPATLMKSSFAANLNGTSPNRHHKLFRFYPAPILSVRVRATLQAHWRGLPGLALSATDLYMYAALATAIL